MDGLMNEDESVFVGLAGYTNDYLGINESRWCRLGYLSRNSGGR